MDIDTPADLNWKEYMVDRLDAGVILVDRELRVLFWNHFMVMHTGRGAEQVVGKNLLEQFPELPQRWLKRKVEGVFVLKNQAFSSWEQRPYLFKLAHNRPMTGGVDAMYQDLSFMPVLDMGGQVMAVCVSLKDVTDAAIYAMQLKEARATLEKEKTEQQSLIKKLEQAQSQLLQSEKMAAIGQLAAGVAHEINNPVGFIKSNVTSMKKYAHDMVKLLDTYIDSEPQLQPDSKQLEQIKQIKDEIDFEYLVEDIDSLIEETIEGVDRVSKIVKDLKDFSHVDQGEWDYEDLHHCLDSTLNVAWNELKYKAEIVKDYGDLPQVYCMGSQINQVFLNMLVNAAHAIANRGTISITTRHQGHHVGISITDNGKGMDEEQQRRVFEPFFTT
ncbi:MAG: ATP-binding protein, partial [Motiliproteus sp.]|nr:ATP-binding protein [Motiliproteus sp.]